MFVHARTFETRWGLGLAFIDMDDQTDVEQLKLQLWAPLGEGGEEAKVVLKIGLNPEASDEAHDRMSEGNRKALVEMTPERFEKVFETWDVAKMLDEAFASLTRGVAA